MYTPGSWPANLIFMVGSVKISQKNYLIPLDFTNVSANLHRKFPKGFGKSQHIALLDSGSTMIRQHRVISSVCQNLLANPDEWAV